MVAVCAIVRSLLRLERPRLVPKAPPPKFGSAARRVWEDERGVPLDASGRARKAQVHPEARMVKN